MMALAAKIGRAEAHRTVETAAQLALSEGRPFREVLLADHDVTAHLEPVEIRQLFDPMKYIGVANEFIDRVLAASRSWVDEEAR